MVPDLDSVQMPDVANSICGHSCDPRGTTMQALIFTGMPTCRGLDHPSRSDAHDSSDLPIDVPITMTSHDIVDLGVTDLDLTRRNCDSIVAPEKRLSGYSCQYNAPV